LAIAAAALAAVVGYPLGWFDFRPQLLLPAGLAAFVVLQLLRRAVTLTDQSVARAAIRAALAEGRRLGPQRWRIEGPAALELDAELRRLQGYWVPGQSSVPGLADPGREASLAALAGPRLAPYLGAFTPAEVRAWQAIDAPRELPAAEPDHLIAESFEPGQDWPTMPEPGRDDE
jgi:hypothetical protein